MPLYVLSHIILTFISQRYIRKLGRGDTQLFLTLLTFQVYTIAKLTFCLTWSNSVFYTTKNTPTPLLKERHILSTFALY